MDTIAGGKMINRILITLTILHRIAIIAKNVHSMYQHHKHRTPNADTSVPPRKRNKLNRRTRF